MEKISTEHSKPQNRSRNQPGLPQSGKKTPICGQILGFHQQKGMALASGELGRLVEGPITSAEPLFQKDLDKWFDMTSA